MDVYSRALQTPKTYASIMDMTKAYSLSKRGFVFINFKQELRSLNQRLPLLTVNSSPVVHDTRQQVERICCRFPSIESA